MKGANTTSAVRKRASDPNTSHCRKRSQEGGKRSKHKPKPTRTERAPAGSKPFDAFRLQVKRLTTGGLGARSGCDWLWFVFGSLAPFLTALSTKTLCLVRLPPFLTALFKRLCVCPLGPFLTAHSTSFAVGLLALNGRCGENEAAP